MKVINQCGEDIYQFDSYEDAVKYLKSVKEGKESED